MRNCLSRMDHISLKPIEKLSEGYISQIKVVHCESKVMFESNLCEYFRNGWKIYSEIVYTPSEPSYMVLLYKI